MSFILLFPELADDHNFSFMPEQKKITKRWVIIAILKWNWYRILLIMQLKLYDNGYSNECDGHFFSRMWKIHVKTENVNDDN